MALTLRGHNSAAQTTSTSHVVTPPVAPNAGDIIVVGIILNVTSTRLEEESSSPRMLASWTPPTGFTQLDDVAAGTINEIATFYKIATGSEPASYTFTSSASWPSGNYCFVVSGAAATSPIAGHQAAGSTVSASTTPPVSSGTTIDHCGLILLGGVSGPTETFTTPSGWTAEDTAGITGTTTQESASFWKADEGTAGSASNVTVTISSVSTGRSAAIVAISPPTTQNFTQPVTGSLSSTGVAKTFDAKKLLGTVGGGSDPEVTRSRNFLADWVSWLRQNNVSGLIGEVGWPNSTDVAQWNALATGFYADAAVAGLRVAGWATGEWWGNTYALLMYLASTNFTIDTVEPPARVLEAQTYSPARGINDSGPEFGSVTGTSSPSTFSNTNLGTYGSNWHYDGLASLQFLAGRGVTFVRVMPRWERLQPTLNAALDVNEVNRLLAYIANAHTAGLSVVVEPYNFGAYWLSNGTQGIRQPIGSAAVPLSAFTDFWTRLSTALKGVAGVLGYGLMNEPVGLTALSGYTEAQTWEQYSQAALTAIRNNSDTTKIFVPGYNWSHISTWRSLHPKSWITDPSNNFEYEGHHYFDNDESGNYVSSYATEVTNATTAGYGTDILGGQLVGQGRKVLVGVLAGLTGLLTKRLLKSPLTGALLPGGILRERLNKATVGSLSPVASLIGVKVLTGVIAIVGSLARSIPKSFTGSITPSGIPRKTIYRLLAGAVTPTGLIVQRSINRFLASSVSPIGTIQKTYRTTYLGAITPNGTVLRTSLFVRIFTGLIAPSGADRLLTRKFFTGGVATSGVVVRRDLRVLSGVLSPTGVKVDLVLTHLLASLGLTGQVATGSTRTFVGSISPTGAFFKTPQPRYGGLLTPSGSLVPLIRRVTQFLGSIGPTASLSPIGQKKLAGVLSSSGTFRDLPLKSLVAFLNSTASVRSSLSKSLIASITPSGVVGTQVVKLLSFSGILDFTGIPTVQSSRYLQGIVSFSGSIRGFISHNLIGFLSPASIIRRVVNVVTLGGLLTPTGAPFGVKNVGLSGSITYFGVLSMFENKRLTALLSPGGVVNMFSTRFVSGGITPLGTLQKQYRTFFVAVISLTGAFIARGQKNLVGFISSTGQIVGRMSKSLQGLVPTTGSIVRLPQRRLGGFFSPQGLSTKSLRRSLVGGLTPSGTILRSFRHILSGTLSPTGVSVKTLFRVMQGLIIPTGRTQLTPCRPVGGILNPTGSPLHFYFFTFLSGRFAPTGQIGRGFPGPRFVGVISPTGTAGNLKGRLLTGFLQINGFTFPVRPVSLAGLIVPSTVAGVDRAVVKVIHGTLKFVTSIFGGSSDVFVISRDFDLQDTPEVEARYQDQTV